MMSTNFTVIFVTSMLSVITPLEAMNVSAGVATAAMEGYVMVIAVIIHIYIYPTFHNN